MTSAIDQAAAAAAGPDRPVFVVGCARSGTTLLQLMLHAHPRIALPPETRFLLRVYDRRERFGDLRRKPNRRRLARFIVGQSKKRFDDLGLDRKTVRRLIVHGPPTLGSAVGIVFREYAARWGKPRWGDKRPGYISRLDVVLALFPDAQIIHIVRDGRDCVSSLKRMGWWSGGSVAAIWYWKSAIQAGARARRSLPADQYREVRYEDLVDHPERELRRLCAFLGEEFDGAMLAPHELAGEAVPERKHHHSRTQQQVDRAAVEQWREQLEPWELALFEFVARRQLRQQGYTPFLRLPLPPPSRLAAYVRLSRRRRLAQAKRRHDDSATAARYGRPVAARLTTAQRRMSGAEST